MSNNEFSSTSDFSLKIEEYTEEEEQAVLRQILKSYMKLDYETNRILKFFCYLNIFCSLSC